MVYPSPRWCPGAAAAARRGGGPARGLPGAPALGLFGHAARITLGVRIGFPFGVPRQFGLGRGAEARVGGCARLPQRQQRQTQRPARCAARRPHRCRRSRRAPWARRGAWRTARRARAAGRGTGAAPWPGTRARHAARPSAWRLRAVVRSRRWPAARPSGAPIAQRQLGGAAFDEHLVLRARRVDHGAGGLRRELEGGAGIAEGPAGAGLEPALEQVQRRRRQPLADAGPQHQPASIRRCRQGRPRGARSGRRRRVPSR